MDPSGNIYRFCECGERVEFDRDCPKCGAESETADTLSGMLKDAVVKEIPDPFSHLRDQLTKEHQRLQRQKPKGKKK